MKVVCGGVFVVFVYGIVIWVMDCVLMGLVLVLWEMSVVFVVLIVCVYFGEWLMLCWVVGCVVIVVGVLLISVFEVVG